MDDVIDFAGDDFEKEPWLYPGTVPTTSGLVQGRSYRRMAPKRCRRLGQASVRSESDDGQESLNQALLFANVARVDYRHLVVAVGSNASPAVMRRKFLKHDVNTTIPFLLAEIAGLRITHSAHVSDAGYIAATPTIASENRERVVVSLLDDQQLGCLDKTEPNYVRRTLSQDMFELTLEGGERPERFHVYASKRGVVAEPGGGPVDLSGQIELFNMLLSRCGGFRALFPGDDPRDAMKALAESSDLREKAAEALDLAGWGAPSGLETDSPASPERYGTIPSSWPDAPQLEGHLTCLSSNDSLRRHGQQCVTVNPSVASALGNPPHVGIQAVQAPRLPQAPARLVIDQGVPVGSAAVDQVLRNALGIELQEGVVLQPIRVHTTPLADRLLSRAHFAMVRVQAADLASVEQEFALLSPLTMSVLGIESGDRAVLQGSTGAGGTVRDVRMTMHTAPDEVVDRREQISGGSLDSRFPSAADALGTFPDLPWIFLDSAARSRLGIEGSKLAIVRIRASRKFQLTREARELLLLLSIAFIGLATLVDSLGEILLMLLAVGTAAGLVVRARLRQRLEIRQTE